MLARLNAISAIRVVDFEGALAAPTQSATTAALTRVVDNAFSRACFLCVLSIPRALAAAAAVRAQRIAVFKLLVQLTLQMLQCLV